jgi:hypothetical protein
MSLCQNSKQGSCGACCGVFNFDLNKNEIHEIVFSRTKYFKDNVDYANRESVIDYRLRFETEEEKYPRKDNATYICPFLGFIQDAKKIGCLIHPILTKDPKSQNFSFYGSSICQSYDCKNKEFHPWIEEVLSSMDLDYYEYSFLAGNHRFVEALIQFYKARDIEIEKDFIKYQEELIRVLRNYLKKNKNHNLTSFELETVEIIIEL